MTTRRRIASGRQAMAMTEGVLVISMVGIALLAGVGAFGKSIAGLFQKSTHRLGAGRTWAAPAADTGSGAGAAGLGGESSGAAAGERAETYVSIFAVQAPAERPAAEAATAAAAAFGPQGAPIAAAFGPGTDTTDARVREALVLAQQGRNAEALRVLQQQVRATGMKDAKARYFLAKQYEKMARAGGPEAEHYRAQALAHLRAAARLGADPTNPANAQFAAEARARLHQHALQTPILNQHAAGGTYPAAYCGPTSLRMVLQQEGLADPGADGVALHDVPGLGPAYTPGNGSSGEILAARARELGLTGASFTTGGETQTITRSLDDGRPVMVSGIGTFNGTAADGSPVSYTTGGHWMTVVGYTQRPDGSVDHYIVNDPNTGLRTNVTPADFNSFFSPEGAGHIYMITYTR